MNWIEEKNVHSSRICYTVPPPVGPCVLYRDSYTSIQAKEIFPHHRKSFLAKCLQHRKISPAHEILPSEMSTYTSIQALSLLRFVRCFAYTISTAFRLHEIISVFCFHHHISTLKKNMDDNCSIFLLDHSLRTNTTTCSHLCFALFAVVCTFCI